MENFLIHIHECVGVLALMPSPRKGDYKSNRTWPQICLVCLHIPRDFNNKVSIQSEFKKECQKGRVACNLEIWGNILETYANKNAIILKFAVKYYQIFSVRSFSLVTRANRWNGQDLWSCSEVLGFRFGWALSMTCLTGNILEKIKLH